MSSKALKEQIAKLNSAIAFNSEAAAEAIASGRTESDYSNPWQAKHPASRYESLLSGLKIELAEAESQLTIAEAEDAKRRVIVDGFQALPCDLQEKVKGTIKQVISKPELRTKIKALKENAADSSMIAAYAYVLLQTAHLVPSGVCYDCGQAKTHCVC